MSEDTPVFPIGEDTRIGQVITKSRKTLQQDAQVHTHHVQMGG